MTTLTPRKDFRDSQLSKGWADVVASPQFEAAAKAAMLEFLFDIHPATTTELGGAATHRLIGAKMFLDKLMSLADGETKLPTPPTGLDYKS